MRGVRNSALNQRSPTFLAPGTGYGEDNLSMEGGGGMVQAVMRVMGSDGGRQMKLRSLARRSPPAVRPGSLQAADPCLKQN